MSPVNRLPYPSGRRPIRTLLKFEDEKESVYRFVREQVAAGRQAYFVYPLIEESETLDLKAATVAFWSICSKRSSRSRVGLLHGGSPRRKRRSHGPVSEPVLDILWRHGH